MKILSRKNTYVRAPPQDPKQFSAYKTKELAFYRKLKEHNTACPRGIESKLKSKDDQLNTINL
jgi:hypothetical protein